MTREGEYRGMRFKVEATQTAPDAWSGRFWLLAGGAATPGGDADEVHPPLDRLWATENEALTYATEAAGHAIEALQLGRPQAQGHGSGSSQRRTDTLGQ